MKAEQPVPAVSLRWAMFGGSGIGLLFGVLMGTSVTPTVATVLGALTTALAAILGLNDRYFNDAKAVRIGSFGFCCVIGAYFGLFVRAHDLFAPSLSDLREQYMAAGFSERQSLAFVAQKAFGVDLSHHSPVAAQPPVAEGGEAAAQVAEPVQVNAELSQQMVNQHSSLLFSAEVDLSSCDELQLTDERLVPEEVVNNFELTGGVWEALAGYTETLDTPQQQKTALLAAKNAICQAPELTVTHCESFKQVGPDDDYAALAERYRALGGIWQQILTTIEPLSLPQAGKAKTLLAIEKALCDDPQ